jgi:predicted signal transduction protein with EAL and GGDEF domain
MIPSYDTTVEDLMHSADMVMYQAKAQNRSALVFFRSGDTPSRQIA